MKWQRYVWTATLLVIWVISLMIVDSTAKQTRMGYQKQKLLQEQRALTERNLRFKCEVSTLHNLEAAEKYCEDHELEFPEGARIQVIEGDENAE